MIIPTLLLFAVVFNSGTLGINQIPNQRAVGSNYILEFNEDIFDTLPEGDPNAIVQALKTFAQTSPAQSKVTTLLTLLKAKYKVNWSSNTITLLNPVQSVLNQVNALLNNIPFLDAVGLRHEMIISLHPNISFTCDATNNWNLVQLNVKAVWDSGYNGVGINVASVDTGVRQSHQEVSGNWRRDGYGWYDPYNFTTTPVDNNGHGTHTMGTIVGQTVGIAPGATWMACAGCDGSGSCYESQLLSCGDWIGEPTRADGTNADGSRRPDIVSNSWGGEQSTSYANMVTTWQKLGIITVFSIGNSGPLCGSQTYPGGEPGVISVGATLNSTQDVITYFSSRGNQSLGFVKPEIVAPGGNIRSSFNTGDSNYACLSGTSMAAPSVTGTIALMLQRYPNWKMDQDTVKQILKNTAIQPGLPLSSISCPNLNSLQPYPNYSYGWGFVNPLAATS